MLDSHLGPDKWDGGKGLIVGVCVEDHVGVRVELVLKSDTPEECPEAIRLLEGEEDEQRDDTSQLGEHSPE